MTVKIQVKNKDGTRSVAGAAVQFTSSTGAPLVTMITDPTGTVLIDTETDGGLLDPGNSVTITAANYYPSSVSTVSLQADNEFWLTPKTDWAKIALYAGGILGVLAVTMMPQNRAK